MATVWIPALMRDLTGGLAQVDVPGATLREVIDALEARFPGVKARLVEDGRLRPSLTALVDGVAAQKHLRQPLAESSEVHFVPTISGGGTVSSR